MYEAVMGKERVAEEMGELMGGCLARDGGTEVLWLALRGVGADLVLRWWKEVELGRLRNMG
jgi:hypothetical protein